MLTLVVLMGVVGSYGFAQGSPSRLERAAGGAARSEPGSSTTMVIPSDEVEPGQAGNASVASFSGFMALVASRVDGTPAPRPTSVADLREQSEAIAYGTIERVTLVPKEVRRGELVASAIELELHLEIDEALKAPGSIDTTEWRQTVWMGDPALAAMTIEKMQTEMGTGPVGARAILFGHVDEAASMARVFDGLVEDQSGSARITIISNPAPKDLTSVAEAVEVCRLS